MCTLIERLKMTHKEIETLLDCDNTILRVLAMSWSDADEYRSVKQNAGQRKALIESAIEDAKLLIQKVKS